MANYIKTKDGVSNDGTKGGIFKGERHSDPSGGIPVNVIGGGSVLVESDEPVIVPEAVNNPKLHSFDGEKLTSKQILDRINRKYGGVSIKKKGGMLEKGGFIKTKSAIPVKAGSVIITRNAALDKKIKHDFNGEKLTNEQVLSRINKDGGGVEFARGGKISNTQSILDKYGKGGKLYESEMSLSEKKLNHSDIEPDMKLEHGGEIIPCGCNYEKGGEVENTLVLCQNCGNNWSIKDKNPNYKYICFKCTYNNEKYYK